MKKLAGRDFEDLLQVRFFILINSAGTKLYLVFSTGLRAPAT
jgi:hypothetical protein